MTWKDKQFNGQVQKPALAQVTIGEAERLNTLLARGEIMKTIEIKPGIQIAVVDSCASQLLTAKDQGKKTDFL